MAYEYGTRLTLRHENGSVLIGEANGYGQVLVGGNPHPTAGWEVVSAAPPIIPEPPASMVKVVVTFPGTTREYTYLGHKSGSRWSWTGATAPSGSWAKFLEWAKKQNATIQEVHILDISAF